MHISFDFDYTLADSSEGTIECANHALDVLGLARGQPADIRKTIGLSLERTFQTLSGIQDADQAAAFKMHFLAHAEHAMLDHIRFYEHTRATLEALKRRGHYTSIVSTKLRARIHEALERDGLDHLVNDVVGGDCVKSNKPDPEGLLRAMRTAGLPAEHTVYVGDSVSDGECASTAGVAFVGVLSGTTGSSALGRWQPVALFDHVGELSRFDTRSLTRQTPPA